MGDHSSLSSWWTSMSSSLKFLLLVVTLILLSGFLLRFTPKVSGVSSSFNPSVLRAESSSSSSSSSSVSSLALKESDSPLEAEEEAEKLDFHPRVVDNHPTELQAALSSSSSSTFNLSSSPSSSLASQIILTPAPAPQPDKVTPEDRKESDGSTLITKVPKKLSRLQRLEAGLSRTRATIREASRNWNQTADQDYIPQGPMYWKPRAFHRSYLEMEKQFKVFIYEEGEPPVFHNGPCKSVYATEGNILNMLEMDSKIRTRDPEKAHVFFVPFSVTMMVRYLYVANSHDIAPIKRTVVDYVDQISKKYPFWNRSLGADHFVVACHDWGPVSSSFVPDMFKNSIRALCNANTSEGFNLKKDVSLPEVHLITGFMEGMIGGPSASRRPILGFFAGGRHGPVRPLIFDHWKNKDNDLQVFEYLPKGVSYTDKMRQSRFCLCPSGYEVASPRVVEAIFAGCIPVLINDHFVPPFNDILNWKAFSVIVPVEEIPNLKRILMSISSRQYIRMYRRLLQVRRHFELNFPAKRFDAYNMILHSIWLRRLNVRINDS